ncbi:MAG: hypothetical protein ABW095_04375 [Candidatus Thiodiazotropha sp.]
MHTGLHNPGNVQATLRGALAVILHPFSACLPIRCRYNHHDTLSSEPQSRIDPQARIPVLSDFPRLMLFLILTLLSGPSLQASLRSHERFWDIQVHQNRFDL